MISFVSLGGYAFLVLLVGLLILMFFHDQYYYHMPKTEVSRPKTGSPFDEGNRIVAAIEKFKKTEGKYPDNLTALVPKYIDKIPEPHWGANRWGYSVYTEAKGAVTFALSVRMRDDYYMCHIYEYGHWTINE
jgi:hypothetical protein